MNRAATIIPVTAEQFGQLEVAWFLCAFPGRRRRLSGSAATDWREAVQHILGYIPDGDWMPEVQAPRQGNGQP